MNKPVQGSLLHLSLTEAAAAVKDGSITSVALTTAALEAFSRVDKVINSSIWLEGAVALEAAEALDKKRESGAKLGPLHGIPLAHKDMYYKAGKLSTCGSSIRKDFRPAYTATVIERLERLEEDKAAIMADMKEVFAEAKGEGYDVKILRKVIRIRKQDKAKRQEEDAILDLYLSALGEI
jgi:uncharacterized protein (UPF0335 family)